MTKSQIAEHLAEKTARPRGRAQFLEELAASPTSRRKNSFTLPLRQARPREPEGGRMANRTGEPSRSRKRVEVRVAKARRTPSSAPKK